MFRWGKKYLHLKYAILLASLVFVAILRPLAPTFLGTHVMEVGLVLTLVACVMVIGRDRHSTRIASALASVAIMAIILPRGGVSEVPVRLLLTNFFLLYVTIRILEDVFTGRDVTADKLFGSVCAYLLIGICFGSAYLCIEVWYPGSFSIAGAPSLRVTSETLNARYAEFYYFSFITMCTVGYGDIFPLSPQARALVMTQAVFGQFYMALMVGRLLALHLSVSQGEGPARASTEAEEVSPGGLDLPKEGI